MRFLMQLTQPRCGKAPSSLMLDTTSADSDAMIERTILLRFEDYGWCKGTIVRKITDRRRGWGSERQLRGQVRH